VSYQFRLRDSADKVRIVVLRGATEQHVDVTAVEERNELDAVSALADAEKNAVPELGIIGVEIDQQIVAVAKGLRDSYGIIVVARTAGPAGEVPLESRDVIRSVNNRPAVTLSGLRKTLQSMTPGSPVTLQIQRDGKLMYVTYTVE
jgi:S1-C subfamily serine protease